MIRRVNGTRVTALAILFASLAACAPPSDAESALRDWVARGEAAAEREDREDGITVVTHIEAIEVYDDTAAKIVLTAGVAGSREQSLLGFSADAVRFEFELEHNGDDWLLTGARWGELGEGIR